MVKFDNEGFRSDILLDIVELTAGGITKVGYWNSSENLNITRPEREEVVQQIEGSLKDKSFRVLIALVSKIFRNSNLINK